MKNKKFFIISILLAGLATVILSSCSFMQSYNTEIYIYDCEHGRIEVSLISENTDEIDFLVTAYPDEGYCLLADFLHIYDNSKEKEILLTSISKQNNSYKFSANHQSKITVTALFTKITQE